VFGDLGQYTLSYPFGNYTDVVNPDPELAELAFSGADFFGFMGNAGVNRRGPNYSTVFLAFPLEATVTTQERAEIIQTVREWCGVSAVTCAADITGPVAGTPDGNVDGLDCLQIISSWGSPCAGSCGGADITGPTPLVPDGNVDSLDFLLMISQWGTPGHCPGQ
jgi:hypothetical protein